jgi:putative toxin-antitoxin system antitoxin component (TIGR02293 family)
MMRSKSTPKSMAVAHPKLLHVAESQQALEFHAEMLSGTEAGAYLALYRASPLDRIALIRQGLPAAEAKFILDDLAIGQETGLRALNLSVATVNKKAKHGERLSMDESERVIGLARLVGQVEAMIADSGDGSDFDAHAWIGGWLTEPLPALGHRRPADLIDTMEGQALVSTALAQIESGAYA